MYLTAHATAGLFIGSQMNNIVWAFLIGFASHFLLDAIPHESTESRNWKNDKQYIKKLALEATLDFWVFIIIALILQINNKLILNPAILAGVIGSILPDFIWGFAELFKIENSFTIKFKLFHEKMHKIFRKEIYLPLKIVAPIQIITIATFLMLYILYS